MPLCMGECRTFSDERERLREWLVACLPARRPRRLTACPFYSFCLLPVLFCCCCLFSTRPNRPSSSRLLKVGEGLVFPPHQGSWRYSSGLLSARLHSNPTSCRRRGQAKVSHSFRVRKFGDVFCRWLWSRVMNLRCSLVHPSTVFTRPNLSHCA